MNEHFCRRAAAAIAVALAFSAAPAAFAQNKEAARSNEFGYANYEVVPEPLFLGTEVKPPVPKPAAKPAAK